MEQDKEKLNKEEQNTEEAVISSDDLKNENKTDKEEEKKEELETDAKEVLEKKPEEKAEKKEVKKEKPEMEEFRTITPQRPKRERVEIKKEFEEKVLEIKRVARVVKGGRRFKFRAAVVLGNHDGKVGIGMGKGSEVTGAVTKAVAKAKKNMVEIERKEGTIPFDTLSSYKGAKILLKPARKGTGIIAGGAVRIVVELAGISDISSKMMGSGNKVNNMIATFNALKEITHAVRTK